jgi:hypothetical protein
MMGEREREEKVHEIPCQFLTCPITGGGSKLRMML